jgi:hypothetical protein
MTAINEQGQVYWTFEDLDLEVEAELVYQEFLVASDKADTFYNTTEEYYAEFKRVDETYNWLSSKRAYWRGRAVVLINVYNNILKLVRYHD